MGNFDFIRDEWPQVHEAASRAESYVTTDPRSACIYSRRAVEILVAHLYDLLDLPATYPDDLAGRIHGAEFTRAAGNGIVGKLDLIRRMGNMAVHQNRPIDAHGALNVLRELFHVVVWAAYHHSAHPDQVPTGSQFDSHLAARSAPLTREQAAAIVRRFHEDDERRHQAEMAARDGQIADQQRQIEELRAQVDAAQAAKTSVDAHDYTEAETRDLFIDVLLREAGWDPDAPNVREYPVHHLPTDTGEGRADYVLWGADGLPLSVVEAKRTRHSSEEGHEQARMYADSLEAETGRRPVIFYTNGQDHWLWDDAAGYPPRAVRGFLTRDELELMIRRRTSRRPLAGAPIDSGIVERYYQTRAIQAIDTAFDQKRRDALLVMATGSGKTRTVIALVDQLMRAGWVKRALFLADRTALVRQAVNAFKDHLPSSSPVNLVEDRDAEGRVYVSTYPTMLNLIHEVSEDSTRHFGPGYFDLVIIDEAHRSVYARYGEIFQYFDAMLVGLTATPKDEVDHNTYRLFHLENGMPTDAYSLEDAVDDGFLVPVRAVSTGTQFLRGGINYDDLSPEERDEWDAADWGDDGPPEEVGADDMNRYLFNEDTVDKVLASLMSDGHKVAGGDRLGKTIIFAKNQAHAEFIARRFDIQWPQYAGGFARVITNRTHGAQQLIEKFEVKDSAPHIAISVDMLDTGIDVPEVVNLVFFKTVHSRSKFWQMIGRGTRLCPDLFGPGEDKADFLVFDWCGNFEFFSEHPAGVEGSTQRSLTQRTFESRVALLRALDRSGQEPELRASTADALRDRVHQMTLDNLLVRPHRRAVERFGSASAWERLTDDDAEEALSLAGLPSSVDADSDDEEARRFDLLILTRQLAQLSDDAATAEQVRVVVQQIAEQLKDRTTIPSVREQAELLEAVAEDDWWVDVTLPMLENLRLRVRGLVRFTERSRRNPVYTDFEDVVGAATEISLPGQTPGMNAERFRQRAQAYLRAREDAPVLRKLRGNEQLTSADLVELEDLLREAGGQGSDDVLAQAADRSGGIGLFIRSLVGLDRAAAKQAFSGFLAERALDATQVMFVNAIIDELTANGAMKADRLYDSPYTDLSASGPEALFREEQIDAIVEILRHVTSTATVE